MASVLSAVQANNPRILSLLLNGPTSSDDVERALLYASREGLLDCVQCLLQGAADPNIQDASGNSPLYLAVKEGHHEIVSALCDAGAKVDARGSSNNTPLHVAAKWGKDECLEALINQGCCINARDSSEATALILAVRNKNYGAIGTLLAEKQCNVNACDNQGRTALHYASHTAVAVDQLLRAGADVNIQDKEGCTPLLMAATEGLDRVIHSLCQASGIDVNISNFGVRKTPLHILAHKGHLRCVKDLIAAGADANLLDKEARTPLWYSVVNSRYDVTALLLRANGQVDTYLCPQNHPVEACPVKLAVDKRLIKVLKLFIISGYDNQHVREYLSHPEAQALFADNQVSHWLRHAHEVTSLRQICRKWLRHHLGFRLFMDLSKLPLPEKLKDYLSLEELEEVLNETS